jgi:IS30 family transposase
MEKVREILRLKELGYNQGEIARSCLVARSTVQDYVRRATAMGVSYEQVKGLKDSEAKALLGKGTRKPSTRKKTIDFEPVQRELKR